MSNTFCTSPPLVCAVPEKVSFPDEEEKILKLWKDLDAFKTSLKKSEGRPEYTFYDGPPFATGLPHYGHILAGTIKVRSTSQPYPKLPGAMPRMPSRLMGVLCSRMW